MGRVIRLVAVAVVGTLMLAACQREEQAPVAPASDPSPQVVNPGTLAAGQQVSVPKGEVVLTMSGTIGNHNKGRKLALDLGPHRGLPPGPLLAGPAPGRASAVGARQPVG
jgi:hypothetical protein